jgi:hypothetical protein
LGIQIGEGAFGNGQDCSTEFFITGGPIMGSGLDEECSGGLTRSITDEFRLKVRKTPMKVAEVTGNSPIGFLGSSKAEKFIPVEFGIESQHHGLVGPPKLNPAQHPPSTPRHLQHGESLPRPIDPVADQLGCSL